MLYFCMCMYQILNSTMSKRLCQPCRLAMLVPYIATQDHHCFTIVIYTSVLF